MEIFWKNIARGRTLHRADKLTEQRPANSKTEAMLGVGQGKPTLKLADTSAELEQALEKEKADRKRERFGWIGALAVVSLPLFYRQVDGSIIPFCIIAVILICVLIVVAGMCGCEEVAILLSALAKRLTRLQSGSDDKPN